MRCERVRPLLSAAVDGEVLPAVASEHLGKCDACQSFAADLSTLRRAVRIETLGAVPDVIPQVMARLPRPTRQRRLVPAAGFLAGAVLGALVGGLVVGGLPGPLPTLAASLPESVVAVQAQMEAFSGRFSLRERIATGLSRSYQGELTYHSPESLHLEIRQVSGPEGWLDNSIGLSVDGTVASSDIPFPCPALDGCRQAERRRVAITGRDPFSASTVAPLDLIVPVSIFRDAREPTKVGERIVAGQAVVGVEITAAQARPLLDGLFQSGNWREIHNTDAVTVWLQQDFYTPLAVSVIAGTGRDRAEWAVRRGYEDPVGVPYLDLIYTDADFAVFHPFQVEVGDSAIDAGFRSIPTGSPPLDPGLPLVASGRVEGAVPVEVWAWSDGRAWLRLDRTTSWPGPGLFGSLGGAVRPVTIGSGTGYLSGDGSTVHIHASGVDLALYGSLDTDELMELAAKLGVPGEPAPSHWPEGQMSTVLPPGTYLPADMEGFLPPMVRLSDGVVIVDLIGTDKRTVRLMQMPLGLQKPPFDPDVRTVEVRETFGRYSPELGLLEWTEGNIALTLSSATLTAEELVEVARILEPK